MKHLFFLTIMMTTLAFGSPPMKIPDPLHNEFTLEGKIPVSYQYRDDTYSSETPLVYKKKQIDRYIGKVQNKEVFYYGDTDLYLYEGLEAYIDQIQGKDVAIMGSVTPWYESMTLAYGGKPTTIEYNTLISKDQRLRVMTPAEYEKRPKKFDAVLSISSFEHDGLGRYGDPIDPNGDLKAMEKVKKMLKKGGLLFLSVPVGKDLLVWNLHRIYGEHRLPLLLEGWEVVATFGFSKEDLQRERGCNHQPVFVLTPIIKN